MNEDEISLADSYLLRSKLHTRCGIRRINQKKYSAGIATIYDAIIAGIRWYLSSPSRVKKFDLFTNGDYYDEQILYSLLKKIDAIEYNDFIEFHTTMELGLDQDLTDNDINIDKILKNFQTIMTKLEILPFDFNELPSENPDLF